MLIVLEMARRKTWKQGHEGSFVLIQNPIKHYCTYAQKRRRTLAERFTFSKMKDLVQAGKENVVLSMAMRGSGVAI